MFSWTLHQKGSPHGGVGVAVGLELYYFGKNDDHCNQDQNCVQVFNTVSLRWRKLTTVTSPGIGEPHSEVPSRRCGHTAVLVEDIVYLWGGVECYGYNYYNQLHTFNVDTHIWSKPQVSGTVPGVRKYHSACVLGKVMYVHGGYTREAGYSNDMYKLDTSTMVWSWVKTRGPQPPVSDEHSATIIGTKMFVFGGWGMHQCYNTIRVFDMESNHWLDTPSIVTHRLLRGRYSHSAFTYNGDLYIFGGAGSGGDLNDVWRFTPKTFSWKKVEPKGKVPSPTCRMCCCKVGDRIILFGEFKWIVEDGTGRWSSSDDLYVLDCSPSLKTLCKLSVVQYGVEQSELPHNLRWELTASND